MARILLETELMELVRGGVLLDGNKPSFSRCSLTYSRLLRVWFVVTLRFVRI